MADLKYKRVIIKVSGEALAKNTGFGVDEKKLSQVCDEIISAQKLGAEIGIVLVEEISGGEDKQILK